MQVFRLNELMTEGRNQRWQEFLRVSSLSMGLYRVKAAQPDEKQPHAEDEVSLVISGKASFRAGEHEPYKASTRGGVVKVRVTKDRAFLGGRAVIVAKGELIA
jgi:hypothetical protein